MALKFITKPILPIICFPEKKRGVYVKKYAICVNIFQPMHRIHSLNL
jgi:hypothetical protein